LPIDECQGVRRISLIKNDISTIKEAIQCPGLRTLLLWNNTKLTSIPETFFDSLKYLIVRDLSQTFYRIIAHVYRECKAPEVPELIRNKHNDVA
jgi:hypothetical protein